MNKRKLYESIMSNVAKLVKKVLNENYSDISNEELLEYVKDAFIKYCDYQVDFHEAGDYIDNTIGELDYNCMLFEPSHEDSYIFNGLNHYQYVDIRTDYSRTYDEYTTYIIVDLDSLIEDYEGDEEELDNYIRDICDIYNNIIEGI